MVLGNPRLHLAHEIRADIRRLGVNPAANTREQSDRGCAEGKPRDDVHHFAG